MNYDLAIDYIFNSIPQFQAAGINAYKPGLDAITELDNHLGNPSRKFKSVHIAGTNGKGSTSTMIYSAFKEAGLKVGLYTSPHLKDFRERMVINGEMISEEEVASFITTNKEIIEKVTPSFFDLTTAMAFDFFARHKVDLAIIETGLGGKLDSTNIITPELSIITNIAFDHMDILGDTLPKIASEKAGIIKSGIQAIIGEHQAETDNIFIETAKKTGSVLVFAEDLFTLSSVQNENVYIIEDNITKQTFPIYMSLVGDYQKKNILTVLAAIYILRQSPAYNFPLDILLRGISKAKITGRWQTLSTDPLTICDTGHNVAGITYVTKQLSRLNYNKLYFVIGIVNDKDFDSISYLLPKDAYYIFTQASISRAMPCTKLASLAMERNLHGEVVPNIPDAIKRAKTLANSDDLIFIGGSTYTVAEIEEI